MEFADFAKMTGKLGKYTEQDNRSAYNYLLAISNTTVLSKPKFKETLETTKSQLTQLLHQY